MPKLNKEDALIIIITAIYESLDVAEKNKVKESLEGKLRDLNNDLKTSHQNGATLVADLAEEITGIDFKSGNGFD